MDNEDAKITNPEETGASSATAPEAAHEVAATALSEEEARAKLQADLDGFNSELKPLLEKYDLRLAGEPLIRPDGGLDAKVIAVRAPASHVPESTPAV